MDYYKQHDRVLTTLKDSEGETIMGRMEWQPKRVAGEGAMMEGVGTKRKGQRWRGKEGKGRKTGDEGSH